VIAITREVSPAIGRCELTHLDRQAIDFTLATLQHEKYEAALQSLGCTIKRLPALPENPDSVFVEDTAVVLPDIAIITRPGAESRRNETASVTELLSQLREIRTVTSPGTIDGGDVIVIGTTIYAGESTRTNSEGIRQLAEFASPFGFDVSPVRVSGCLHLKSAATAVGDDTILFNPEWVNRDYFTSWETIAIDISEPFGANAVSFGRDLIYPTGFDRTAEKLENAGFSLRRVDVGELQKAEGAVTCCSILLNE
jgi:dimethylargininase